MVTSDEIEFLTIKDLMNQTIPLTSIFELKYLEYIDYLFDNIECNKEVKINNKKLIWKPLEEYSKDMF